MIKILIVEDQPAFKVEDALDYLKFKNLKFELKMFSSAVSSMRYIRDNLEEIDLAIIDLGIPYFENEPIRTKTQGFEVIQEIERLIRNRSIKKSFSIIINSTTKLELPRGMTEEEYFSDSKTRCGTIIEHVEELEGSYLYEFIEKNMPEKIEFQ